MQFVSVGQPASPTRGTFRCPICGQNVKPGELRAHAALDDGRFREDLLIARIKQDHPEWVETGGTCEYCLEQYRQMVASAQGKIRVLSRQREI